MDISTIDRSVPRARQLRDEPPSGRYPTRGYQQRQPSLERGAADQMDLKNDEPGKSALRDTHGRLVQRVLDRVILLPSTALAELPKLPDGCFDGEFQALPSVLDTRSSRIPVNAAVVSGLTGRELA